MTIEFEKVTEKVRFLSPLAGMQEVTSDIERRRDPLTGSWAVYSSALTGKGDMFFGPPDRELIGKLAEESAKNCFFCPDKVEAVTPRYPEDWLKGGCLKAGECFLFPNLFPIGPVHAVIALGHAHYREIADFPADLLRQGLGLAVKFVKSVRAADPAVKHFSVNMNYLPPAGASLVHPHVQILGGRHPATAVEELVAACKGFAQETKTSYHQQLVDQEKQAGERYVAAFGPVHWLIPFAPMGTNEVLGITDCRHLAELDGPALDGMAEGLSRVLAWYGQLGFVSFNFTVYSAAMGEENDFPVFVRAVCRQNLTANYRCDDYFMQKLLKEELFLSTPEEQASGFRDFLGSG
jgi:galactose-1-phosphate uridylyltransferase